MKYKIADFKIACANDLFQITRDLLADAAGEVGFESFEETEEGLKGYIQDQFFDVQTLKKALEDFPLANVQISYQLSDAEDKNWNEAWEKTGFEAIIINEKVVIYDAKSDFSSNDSHQLPIGIEAKQAFGTGNHQTTRMIISSMLEMNLHKKRVLDCGCGTGILGITACKLGASEVVSYDIDEWSVKNTKHNAQINGVEHIEVLLGDVNVLSHVCGVFDLVLANINRNILINDMPIFKEMMNAEGMIIISGFYENDAPLLLEKAAELGLEEMGRKTEKKWCCLLLSKK